MDNEMEAGMMQGLKASGNGSLHGVEDPDTDPGILQSL